MAEQVRRNEEIHTERDRDCALQGEAVGAPSPEIQAAIERVRSAELTRLFYGADLTLVGGANTETIVSRPNRLYAAVNSSFLRFVHAPDLLFTGPGYFGMVREPQHAHIRFVRAFELNEGREFHRRIDVPVLSETFKGCSPYGPGDEWYNVLSKRLKTRPLTGIAALAFLLRFPFRSIHLTGFDFYSQPQGYIPFQFGGHRLFSQVDWLRDTIETDARVSMDTDSLTILFPEFPREEISRVTTSTGYDLIRPLGYANQEPF